MFFRKKERNEVISEELQREMEHSKRLVEESRKRMTDKGFALTLTCRLQLDDDCRAVNQAIAKIEKGNFTAKDVEKLHKAYLCLQTTSQNILDWKWEE